MHPAFTSDLSSDGHYASLSADGHYTGHYASQNDGHYTGHYASAGEDGHYAAGQDGHYSGGDGHYSGTKSFHCQEPNAAIQCYGPAQIQAAYGFDQLINNGKDGSGQTIVIVDAFQNPTMNQDLASFDKAFNLPNANLKIMAPFGLTPFDATDPNQVGWSGEIALDVEWAHAMAPGAKIDLVLAASDNDADLVAAEGYAIQHKLGNVMSMSYSEAEQCMDPTLQAQEHSLFQTANKQGMTLFAASGDFGAAQLTCDGNSFIQAAAIPASDPDVTGVGGTDLVANLKSGAYQSESVWNDDGGAGGGGFSTLYSRPKFQNGAISNSMRGVPDVAFSGSSSHGAIVAWGSSGNNGEFWVFSGTSIGTPQWAALTAIADQAAGGGLGNINSTLYALNDGFNDITSGNNNFAPVNGFKAKSGWDAASGLGSPRATKLVNALSR